MLLDTKTEKNSLDLVGEQYAFAMRDYILAEVTKYVAELNVGEGDKPITKEDVEGMIEAESDRLEDMLKKNYLRTNDISDAIDDCLQSNSTIEDYVVDAIRDNYRARDSITDIVTDRLDGSTFSSRLDNVEQKLNKLINILSDVKSNVGEYE